MRCAPLLRLLVLCLLSGVALPAQWTVRGVALGPDDRPVADARVDVLGAAAPIAEGRTSPRGWFEVHCGSRPRSSGGGGGFGGLVSVRTDSLAGVCSFWPDPHPGVLDVGVVRLHETNDVLVSFAGEPPPAKAALGLWYRHGSVYWPLRTLEASGGPRLEVPGLLDGSYILASPLMPGERWFARFEIEGPSEALLAHSAGDSLRVLPVDRTTGEPVGEGELRLRWAGRSRPGTLTRTLALTGRVIDMDGLGSEEATYDIEVRAPGYCTESSESIRPDGDEVVRLGLTPLKEISWPLAEVIPGDLRSVRLDGNPDLIRSARARVADGRLIVTGLDSPDPWRSLYILAEGGEFAAATLQVRAWDAPPLRFRPLNRLRAVVRDTLDRPLSGIALRVPYGHCASTAVRSDAEGGATLRGLYDLPVQILVCSDEHAPADQGVLTSPVNPQEVDTLEVRLTEEQIIVLHFAILGLPRLPRDLTLRIPWAAWRVVRESAVSAEVVVACRWMVDERSVASAREVHVSGRGVQDAVVSVAGEGGVITREVWLRTWR